jgi:D-serine deaminase-like pyridoxal phosphate-dependent protein
MRSQLKRLGVPLRPHVKTAKSFDVIQRALEGEPGGITVSTLKEAEYFFGHGVCDILYAVGIAPSKLLHAIELVKRGVSLTLISDNTVAVQAAQEAARQAGVTLPMLIEIDVDGHRSGIQPESPTLLEVARAMAASSNITLRGVMTHAGGSYGCRSPQALRDYAEQERSSTVRAAQRLREASFDSPVVSIGSTPTALSAQSLVGVTEVRAGVYLFQDLVMAGIGVCSIDEIALSVLVSVIGHQQERGWIITDGGWMALSRDRGTSVQPVDQGYGVVLSASGETLADDLIMISANQEHGILSARDGASFDLTRYPVGTLLRVLPNHACATAAQHSRYQVLSGAAPQVLTTWDRFSGW